MLQCSLPHLAQDKHKLEPSSKRQEPEKASKIAPPTAGAVIVRARSSETCCSKHQTTNMTQKWCHCISTILGDQAPEPRSEGDSKPKSMQAESFYADAPVRWCRDRDVCGYASHVDTIRRYFDRALHPCADTLFCQEVRGEQAWVCADMPLW